MSADMRATSRVNNLLPVYSFGVHADMRGSDLLFSLVAFETVTQPDWGMSFRHNEGSGKGKAEQGPKGKAQHGPNGRA